MSSQDTTRPDWDQYFIDIAWAVSSRATCPVRRVGAVLVDPTTKSIKTTSYNGAPRGADHCPPHESGAQECLALHAETNLITNAALNGISTKGSWLYLTCTPCMKCAPLTLNAGIERVVCDDLYRDVSGVVYLRRHDVSVRVLSEEKYGVPVWSWGQKKPIYLTPQLDNWFWNKDIGGWERID